MPAPVHEERPPAVYDRTAAEIRLNFGVQADPGAVAWARAACRMPGDSFDLYMYMYKLESQTA